MNQIWKFPLPPEKNAVIKMPKDAKILCAQLQFGEAMIWAIVDPDAPLENRYFKNVLTGHEFVYSGTEVYLGTYQVDGGIFIVHVFEVKK